MEFSGRPSIYLRTAIIGSIVINLYLYLALSAILYFVHDQTWMFGPKPIIVTVLFTAFFARLYYRWTMRLDAQFGTGKGWKLVECTVKLPEPVRRK